MKTILFLFLIFSFSICFNIAFSQKSKKAESGQSELKYTVNDEWKKEMSGVYEGNIEVAFADGGNTAFGKICIDLLNDSPSVSIDGVLIPDFNLTKNNIKNNTWYIYSLIEIHYEKSSNTCISSFDDAYGMNDGNNIKYVWNKTGDPDMAKTEIEKLKSEDKIFSLFWERFVFAFMNNDFKEISSVVTYPIVDSCTKEVINNEIELEIKLRNILKSETMDNLGKEPDKMRIVDHYAKKLGGRFYYQKNGSIFFDVVEGKVKLKNFHCLFG